MPAQIPDMRLRATDNRGQQPEILYIGSLNIDFPFHSEISPDTAFAHEHHVAWMSEFGLIKAGAPLNEYASWRTSDLALRWFPRARGEQAALVADATGWTFPFDDHFNGELGRSPNEVEALVEDLVAVTRSGNQTRSQEPLVKSFADLWLRMTAGSTASWRHRLEEHWCDYFRSHVDEAHHRIDGWNPTVLEYLAARRRSIGSDLAFDFAERFTGEILPDVRELVKFQNLMRAASDIFVLLNDLASGSVEAALGDQLGNLLFLLNKDSLTAAETALGKLVHERICDFLGNERSLLSSQAYLSLGQSDGTSVAEFILFLRGFIAGFAVWGSMTNRYQLGSPGK